MKHVKIHIFDDSVMMDPLGSCDRKVYKKMSTPNDIYPVTAKDGSYLICFSSSSASVILPSSLLNRLEASFRSKGGLEIDDVVYHTSSARPADSRIKRWLEVLLGDLNNRQRSMDEVYLSIVDDAPQSRVMDFSSSQALREPPATENPFDEAMKNLGALGDDTDNPFDDVGWGGEPIQEKDSDRSEDPEYQGDDGTLECFNLRKAEKNWNKHKIIVADKETIRHDSEVIRGVLKEIAPGDEPWKVLARAHLEKRIMRCIAITKSELEEIERSGGIGQIFSGTKTALEFTGLGLSIAGGINSLVGKRRL